MAQLLGCRRYNQELDSTVCIPSCSGYSMILRNWKFKKKCFSVWVCTSKGEQLAIKSTLSFLPLTWLIWLPHGAT